MGNDLEILWNLTQSEETVVKMIRGLRDNPETREEAIYEALENAARKATEERN
jgi:hypothetical protein